MYVGIYVFIHLHEHRNIFTWKHKEMEKFKKQSGWWGGIETITDLFLMNNYASLLLLKICCDILIKRFNKLMKRDWKGEKRKRETGRGTYVD